MVDEVKVKASFGGMFAEYNWLTIDFGNDQKLSLKLSEKQLCELAHQIAYVVRESATYRRKYSIGLTKTLSTIDN